MRAAFVTGAGSGIGRAVALALGARGFRVFAGVRSQEAAEAVRADGFEPVVADVRDEAAVREAARAVEAALGDARDGRSLGGGPAAFALVNNAGVAVGGPLELVPAAEFRDQLDVNVTGQLLVTQAFLPLLRRTRGRIVLMGSMSGLVALPFLGPYSISKFALEAMADTLRVELAPFGVAVSIVEPGSVATPIWSKSVERARRWFEAAPPEAVAPYREMIERTMRAALRAGERGIAPERVAEAVVHALTSPRPRARYLVAPPARARETLLLRRLPTRLRDRLILGALRPRPRR
ncbi:MAG: SDR family NAD(P)-dependent oxidoreductase [Clostridia bacterium]|nr:SDR family NAD(P)-dependent oxidoreductase [Clostridia bacterium]